MRMCETTEPPFCASPVISSTPQPLPSRCAAMPISAPMVTTPVPPTPVTTALYNVTSPAKTGAGNKLTSGRGRAISPPVFFC